MTAINPQSLTLDDYSFIDIIHQTDITRTYKAVRKSNAASVTIKFLNCASASTSELERFQSEIQTIQNSHISGVITIHDLFPHPDGFALVLEDLDTVPLKTFINKQPADLERFLTIAKQLAKTTALLHEKNLIHKNINPYSVHILPETCETTLSDFGILQDITRENDDIHSLDVIETALRYKSPEQTGRMNRPIDHRADMYSLGVVFYEMLTKNAPFTTDDPMELIHAHLAKNPMAPEKVDPSIPKQISDIVMKLLSKPAEDRYQSMFGLFNDLERCRESLANTGAIKHFKLGNNDIPLYFTLPNISIGRESEKKRFTDAIEDAIERCRLKAIFVSGYPGIGKSFLVNTLQSFIAERNGYFAASKYTPFEQNLPYSGIIQAITHLIRQVLTEPPEKIDIVRSRLQEALGLNGKVITDIIPLLETIIGVQPDISELTPEDSLNRFRHVFRNFLGVLAQKDHPLILFLDDLHLADIASLKFIEMMLKDAQNMAFVFIGVYRHNEINATHLLHALIENIQKSSLQYIPITVSPFSEKEIERYLSNALRLEEKNVSSLTPLVKEKTNGNPFFINQFLHILYIENVIPPSFMKPFSWDLKRIRSIQLPENVIEIMIEKILKLASNRRDVLQCAACIGPYFNLKTLSAIIKKPVEDLERILQNLLEKELLDHPQEAEYHMSDQIQNAAYFLTPEKERIRYHSAIGRYLFKVTNKEDLVNKIFHIVNQFNAGRLAINDKVEKRNVAELNLIAGKKANASGAYQSAFGYFKNGLAFLENDSWRTNYTLTYELYTNVADTAYRNGEFDIMNRYLSIISENTSNLLDNVVVYEIRILASIAKNKLVEAVTTALEIIGMLGITLPDPITREALIDKFIATGALLEETTDADILNAPRMDDPYSLAIIRIMTFSINAFHGASYIHESVILTLEIVQLSIVKGIAPQTPYWFSCYAMALYTIDQLGAAFRFSDLALKIKKKFDLRGEIRTDLNIIACIAPWKQPIRSFINRYITIYNKGLEIGDTDYTHRSMATFDFMQWAAGKELHAIQSDAVTFAASAKRHSLQTPLNYIEIRFQAGENLLGHSQTATLLEGSGFNAAKRVPQLIANRDHLSLFLVHFYSMYLNFIFGETDKAVSESEAIKPYVYAISGGFFHIVLFYYYRSLVRLSGLEQLPLEEQTRLFPKIEYAQNKLKRWLPYAPSNFQNKIDLIEAEMARIKGDILNAEVYYESAIRSAHEAGFLHEEALSFERAALFYSARRMDEIATLYMVRACACYEKWGAFAKVEHLQKTHPNLLSMGMKEMASLTNIVPPANGKTALLDFAAIMKASQAISGEIVLSNLMKRLIHIGIENAGAQRGALISEHEGRLFVEAVSDMNGTISILSQMPLKAFEKLPAGVIHYVHSTNENIVLANASQDTRFSHDPYITANFVKSILCIPIRYKNKIAGIFYLENNFSTAAFPEDRIEVLTALFSQAAISLENARLYKEAKDAQEDLRQHHDHLEEMVHERTQELRAVQQELIESAHLAGKADVAAGVLHNVGNVLNSVCTSIHTMENILNTSAVFDGYANADNLLRNHIDTIEEFIANDSRGKKLLEYYLNLGEMLLNDRQELRNEVKRLSDKAAAITNIIDAQQSYASGRGLMENLDITHIVEDALIMQSESLKKQRIQVVKEFQPVPKAILDKTKLIHVLINILTNAKQAMHDMPTDQKLLSISIWADQNSIFVSFRDTGTGIKKSDLKRIFGSGFTTKINGHGFGLHSSANYMTEMGGRMWAESDGPATGATFIITLPC